ncbi:mini-chromosome maintenance complex-binding protein-like isoform X2 [Acanthaster planci]|uniref:Mini-chromosome maintenance complex-binding protein n=1 Tax=Acanthaster planci TaxID=133434 RepID=A0A8B7YJZ4_ACAPL|nr:mini-chromosome maintenance complex-binding protein-like isoform X2 [Acanthaster planci]
MPGIEDWLNCPLDIVQGLFDVTNKNWSNKVTEYFNKKLQDKDSLEWVPSLNHTSLHLLKANTLVRFRCMIQDMYDPEFYLGAYEVVDKTSGQTTIKSGTFQDLAECTQNQRLNLESSRNVTLDRQTFYCVPVPAETEWVKQAFAENSRYQTCDPITSQSSRVKRALEVDDTTVSSAQPISNQSGDHDTDVTMETSDVSQFDKRTRRSEATGHGSMTPVDLNFPLPEEKGPACMVKVYDHFESFRVNDIVEFIGVLSVDPELANLPGQDNNGGLSSAIDGADEMEGIEEQTAHSPPPSLVPRLHAVISHKLQHINPMLPVSLESEEGNIFVQSMMGELGSVRDQLRCLLQQVLFGDSLSADYLLLNLVSSVYARRDVVALGKFTVNLIGCQESGFSQMLQGLLSQLVTKFHLLPLSLQNMNSLRLTPKKDYTANRLKSGVLQLSDRTHVLLDETALQPGQLDTNGVHNLAAIGNAISWQKVDYDFEFHKTEFKTNLVFLVTSEGKSLLPHDCQVVLQPKTSLNIADVQRGIHQLISSGSVNLTRIRTYLGIIPFIQYNLTEEMSKIVEQDFVEARKSDPSQMTQEDFHSLLIVARLLSVSMGHKSLTRDIWERTKRMEQERKIRLKNASSQQ